MSPKGHPINPARVFPPDPGIPQCPRCTQLHVTRYGHQACTGHRDLEDGSLEPCTNAPRKGSQVCGYHGGKAPQVEAAAAARIEEKTARAAVQTLGLPIDIAPTDALLEEVRWTAGHVQWLRGKVQELQAEPSHTMTSLVDGEPLGYGNPTGAGALTWGTTKVTTGDTAGTTQEAKPSIWYELYTRERAHLVKVCAEAIKAGVEERKVRLAEAQAGVVVGVIQRILDGLYQALIAAGITPDILETAWRAAIADVVPRELRAAALGGAA